MADGTGEVRLVGETADLLFLAKPAGLPVFPHPERPGASLLGHLLMMCPQQASHPWPEAFAGGIAHRLDNGTSGLLLVARSIPALTALRQAFADKKLDKHYLFLTDRRVPWSEHRVDEPIAHDRRHRSRMVVMRGRATPHRGRWLPAETGLRHLEGPLWEARIRSGVTHQIRIHAAFAGLAILGDRLYGGSPMPMGAGPGGESAFCLHHREVQATNWSSPQVCMPAWWQGLPPGPAR